MKPVLAQRTIANGNLPFLLLLGFVILISLVSAIVPLGPVASRAAGPAFSPSTASVAIRASASAMAPDVRPVVPPLSDPPAFGFVAVAAFLIAHVAAIRLPAPSTHVTVCGRIGLSSCHQARAPPR